MKRFINIGTQTGNQEEGIGEFSFFDTITDKFEEHSDSMTWATREEFIEDYEGRYLERYLTLIPKNWKCKPENMTKKELRTMFEKETVTHWENSQCEPDIDYVEWLEARIISQSPIVNANGALAVDCDHYMHGHCDCLGKYCMDGIEK